MSKNAPLWFSEYEYAQHVLDGSVEDRGYYAAIYQADPKRIESDPEYWKSRERASPLIHRTKTMGAFWPITPSKRK